MAHRIDGRKLGRKHGPRMSLYANLIVAVLRYERVKTTEAKAKEIRPQVERMITLAKRGDLAARRTVVAELPDEPLVIRKLFDEIAPKYADRTSRVHPPGARRPASRRRSPDRPDRARLTGTDPRRSADAVMRRRAATKQAPERAPPCATARGSNTTERTSPGTRPSRAPGRSRGSSRPRSPRSPADAGCGSTRRDGPTRESTRQAR